MTTGYVEPQVGIEPTTARIQPPDSRAKSRYDNDITNRQSGLPGAKRARKVSSNDDETTTTETYRRCKTCGKSKPLSEFGKHRRSKGGRRAHCKPCRAAARRAGVDSLTEEQRERQRESWRQHYERNPEYHRERRTKYRGTPEHRARKRVWVAVQSGRLTKPDACTECGAAGPLEAHHADYSRPLDVEWLCTRCHGKRHRKANPLRRRNTVRRAAPAWGSLR